MMGGKEIVEKASEKFRFAPGEGTAETSSLWKFVDGRGDLGLITPMSDPFCDDCDRVRLTADGKLLSCLFDTEYYDLRHLRQRRRNGLKN